MNSLKIGNLTVKIPIVQGGMGIAISLSGLASAVAKQGGIGVISAAGIGMTEPNFKKEGFKKSNIVALRKHIQRAKELSEGNGAIGVNLMVALTDYDDLLVVAIEEKADIVFMGAGLPLRLPQFVLDQGFENIHTKFAVKVSGGKAAKLIFRYWDEKFGHIPDAVAVEGPMAGGHLGFKKKQLLEDDIKLSTLVEETVEAIKEYEAKYNKEVPVIAAGGIYTGKDIRDIMKAGAKAVKMGTRFVATHECDADIAFKESYIKSSKEDITLIDSPVGLPGRVIGSEFVDKINNGGTKPFKCPWKCLKTCNFKEAPYCISEILHNSSRGMLDDGFAFAGSNAFRNEKIISVKELMDELIEGYENSATE
ncbi:MAG: nitronate monooxygenase [Salinivirgaceae bacterium]|jgi:nitronate monooxygenase|nr:nitronate monooxygenase [Salinivirgaceae bacterium]